jgi:PAS domain S-box-containing protein
MPFALVAGAAAAAVGAAVLGLAARRWRSEASRWAVTAEISVLLAESLDPVATLEAVLRLLVPRFGDWSVIHVIESGGRVRRQTIVHADRAVEAQLRGIRDIPFDAGAQSGPAFVIRSGRPELLRAMRPELFEGTGEDTRRAVELAGLGSGVIVPLRARQQTLGALTLSSRRPHCYDEADLTWAEDLGHRIGLALENAHLYLEARELFEQTISANFVSTPEGQILACNQSFARLLGLDSVEQVLASPAVSFYANPERRDEALALLLEHRRLVGFESTIRRRDGTLVAISENAVGTFDEQGRLTRIRGFILDVSAQKRLEEQLRQAHRLEAIGQLAGGIAHDFNNLLTVIIGCADLVQAERASPVPIRVRDQHDHLEELMKAARRAAALTQQLLAFSRRQQLQPTLVDMNASLRAMHSMLRRLVRENIVIVLDLEPTLPPVRVDQGQLDQVIINLVVNSGDAMPAGGTVSLKTGNLVHPGGHIDAHPYVKAGSYATLTVKDTGTGMDEATRARVFEPFFTTKPVGKGTGLGLSTVYGIVKQSNGYVLIDSTMNVGTTVTVCLPAASGDVG